jgi:hypothetical protein
MICDDALTGLITVAVLIYLRGDSLHGFVHLEIILAELRRYVLDAIQVVTLLDG